MLKLKLQYFGHLMWRTDLWEKTLMLGKIEGRKRGGWQKMKWFDSITNSQSLLKLMSIESVMPYQTIWSSVVPFSSFPQSFPAWGFFLMSQLFELGSKTIGTSTSASVLPMNIQDWFPLGLIGLISLQRTLKGLSRVSSNITVQRHQFFGAQPSLRFNSHIHIWPLEKP